MAESELGKDHSTEDKPAGSPERASSEGEGKDSGTSPKPKRRKVNHACLYCRRSHMTCDLDRPCTRCIKRNIGHLCHDEPREAVRRTKSGGHVVDNNGNGTESSQQHQLQQPHQLQPGDGVTAHQQEQQPAGSLAHQAHQQQRQIDQQLLNESDAGLPAAIRTGGVAQDGGRVEGGGVGGGGGGGGRAGGGPSTASLEALNGGVPPPPSLTREYWPALPPASAARPTTLDEAEDQDVLKESAVGSADEWRLTGQNPFHDIHTYHPSYMFHAHEVTNEYNLLNEFLSSSLLDEGAMYGAAGGSSSAGAGGVGGSIGGGHPTDHTTLYGDVGTATSMNPAMPSAAAVAAAPPSQPVQQALLGPPLAPASSIRRPSSVAPIDKAQENYYMTAADPTGGGDSLGTLLQAKYDAGMLRPFNYVKGYARLNRYMEQNIHPESRQKILRQLDRFRPKFRERMQGLSDVELVLVEMWFERCLMEYDRVFASMAVPACCWRRTGEIFRGNKEMAQLIHVPIESLRDGKLAIHDILVEEHLVSYWQKFGAIAFDNSQKAMLTTCSLKNPDLRSKDPHIPCCFSFTIRRDEHNIPSLIVGNFLPITPEKVKP